VTTPDRDPFEDRLSAAFRDHADAPTDVDGFLSDVHSGARRRRTRRNIAGGAAAVLLVAGGGAVVTQADLFDHGAPVADHHTTTATSPTSPTTSNGTPLPLGGVLSLTSTGSEAQWALVASSGVGCGHTPCGIVLANPVGTDAWTQLAGLRVPAGTDPTSMDSISQVRFAGSATSRYDGWVFGGALLTTHSDAHHEAGASWNDLTLPWMDGPVTALEAHGDLVYAVVSGPTPTLMSSPVDHDAWRQVDTGYALHDVQQLAVSTGVVGLLDQSDGGSTVLTLDAGTWAESDPCGGHVTQLSTASSTLWALCDDGASSTVWRRSDGSTEWTQTGSTYPSGSELAGRSADHALVATPDGVRDISADADEKVSGQDFSNASMFGFTNPGVGFAIVDGQVYRTDDGGGDWREVNVGG
jgi:hypothetical protein